MANSDYYVKFIGFPPLNLIAFDFRVVEILNQLCY